MKKIIAIIISILMVVSLAACASTSDTSTDAEETGANLNIVTTIFPIYDWVREVLGDEVDNNTLTMLVDSGVDLHSFEPTADDLITIYSADVFIYNGGESDEWVEDVLENATNSDMVVINLLEVLGDDALMEVSVDGMQESDDDDHDHDDEEETDEDEDDHDHDDEEETDEDEDDHDHDDEETTDEDEDDHDHDDEEETDEDEDDHDHDDEEETDEDEDDHDDEETTDEDEDDHDHDDEETTDEDEDDHDHDDEEETDEDEDDHDHDDEDEDSETHEHSHEDEHIWLSLNNAQTLTAYLAEQFAAIDADNADTYTANQEAYAVSLAALDADYAEVVENATFDTILFADRFPFRYLTEDYDITYYAAFSGCSSETEASFETITFLADKVDELGLTTVLIIDGATTDIADTVIANTASGDQEILVLDSMQSVTSSMADSTSYLEIMQSNLEVLEAALN